MKCIINILAILATLTICFCPGDLYAEKKLQAAQDTIDADRPNQTDGPGVIPKGKFQLEVGLIVNPFDSTGRETPVIGTCVLRYGINDRIEARLNIQDGQQRDRFIEETVQSKYPLAAGGKILLLKQSSGLLPKTAFEFWLNLPFTCRASEQTIYWSPQLYFAFENEITDKIKLEYNIGTKQSSTGKEWQEQVSAALLTELSKKVKAFAEYFGGYQHFEQPMHNADVGLMYLLSPKLQLDVALGRSFSAPEEKRNGFGSAGFSVVF